MIGPIHMAPLLAAGPFGQAGPVIAWVVVLIALALGGGLVAVWLRRRLREGPTGVGDSDLLERWRALHARGEISDQEFAALRRSLGGRVAARMGVPGADAATGNRKGTPGPITGPDGAVRAAPGFDLTGRRLPPASPPG